ncbi:MAG: transglutaminase domain-containing protein [Puniceicoccaceae bacterium]
MRLQVHHHTEYLYGNPVSDNINELRLTPRCNRRQDCESSFISILPASRLSHYEDLNINRVHRFEIPQPHSRLVIDSRATVVTFPYVDFDNLPYGFLHCELGGCRYLEECHPFLQNSSLVEVSPEAWRLGLDIRDSSEDVFQTSYAIMEYIFRNFSYASGATTVSTHSQSVLENRTGVCQDFAHAMVAICRSIGIPARYVSGYFYDATRDRSLRGSEASHAWVDVYIKDFGWVGLDPTNNKVVDETYIVLAIGRDYKDVAPVKGSYRGTGRSAMSIGVRVEKLD